MSAMNVRKTFDRSRRALFASARRAGIVAIASGCLWLAVGCGSREGENEAKMTSYSNG